MNGFARIGARFAMQPPGAKPLDPITRTWNQPFVSLGTVIELTKNGNNGKPPNCSESMGCVYRKRT